jgi:malate dehydrogenase
MAKPLIRVALTGGAGNISYSLVFRIGAGELFGPDQPVALHILELPEALRSLEGIGLELEDCAFPLLKEIHLGSDPLQIFKGVHYALLIGAKPRGPGMERKELLQDNGKIFVGQGKALNAVADADVKVLVVGNPCNTNCLIALSHAPRIPRKNFHAMTRLDQNRAVAQLAQKARVGVEKVSPIAIWGNHSSTQVPDFIHATISGKPLLDVIKDRTWLENDFFSCVQKRGARIIEARGKSSAASAASAIIDAVKAIAQPTAPGEWFSSAIFSEKNGYGIDENLIFSFPCRIEKGKSYEIVTGLKWDDFLKEKIQESEKELQEERKLVIDLLR